ncbi:MAG: hypothetical protein H6739_09475 [Alphaproteobacteria bacterium]|nr:hypothetical protein [Alphaproteobacteria bacterium]
MTLLTLLLACAGAPAPEPQPAAAASTAAQQAPPPPTSLADGVVIWLAPGTHHDSKVELVCMGDAPYRERFDLSQGRVGFPGVPEGADCTVYFKGGAPAQFAPVRRGQVLRCNIVGTTATCEDST